MKKSRLLSVACACIFTLITTPTYAVTIDFEGVLSSTQGSTGSNVIPYTENGFLLTSSQSTVVYHNDIFGDGFSVNDNGSDIFGWCGNCGIPTLTLARIGGGMFSLSSIDFSNLYIGLDVRTINITGLFSGGGSITQSFDPTVDVWTTATFTGFEGLSSLTVAAATIGAHLAMDNIVVNAVPIPPSVWLFGSGLLGLIGLARRKA